MQDSTLNLARKWRSKNFDQVIGQELSVRMLKNSLYRDLYFPVYLFSGQRGCGKTSTARIFAAALNCEQLSAFQQSPKTQAVPCASCASCIAMSTGRHPDFFEIDAASHTGVDNIRHIIDACQLLPVMGRKKIYLIDEAHMLSKASFNALLKVLEEPPRSVVFILATTDPHKIIETVRPRCFQLLFSPVASDRLYEHLVQICERESIACDQEGLKMIASESDGSVRDALNLLEQVRFSSSKINKQAVLAVLGHIDDEQLLTLFEKVLTSSPKDLLAYMQEIRFESFSAERVWERLITLVRAALWIKHGVHSVYFEQHAARIKRLVSTCPWQVLADLLERLHADQALFTRTTAKHAVLEMILLQVCQNSRNNSGPSGAAAQAAPAKPADDDFVEDDEDDEELDEEDEDDEEQEEEDIAFLWSRFVQDVERLGDPLLRSVFQQGRCLGLENSILTVEFSKQFIFFQDWLQDARDAWGPILRATFGKNVILQPQFTGAVHEVAAPIVSAAPVRVRTEGEHKPASAPVAVQQTSTYNNYPRTARRATNSARRAPEPQLDISDIQVWVKAPMLLRHFPGTLTEIGESIHG